MQVRPPWKVLDMLLEKAGDRSTTPGVHSRVTVKCCMLVLSEFRGCFEVYPFSRRSPRGRARARHGAAARMVRARLCCLFLLLGPGATLAFQMSAPRGARAGHHLPNERRRCAARCTEPEPAERTPETADNARERKEEDTALAADLLSEPADNRETEEFTLVAGAKELQRVLVTDGFGLQVAAATLVFGGASYWVGEALSSDPFWSSPILPQ